MLYGLENVLGAIFAKIVQEKKAENVRACAAILRNKAPTDKDLKAMHAQLTTLADCLDQFADAWSKNHKNGVDLLKQFTSEQSLREKYGGDWEIVRGFWGALYEEYSQDGIVSEDILQQVRRIKTQPMRFRVSQLFARKSQSKDYYKLLHERGKELVADENYFLNLKGMSSSTPLLYNSTFHTDYSGGGFYIRWQGTGIVVDPGYGFVQNMAAHSLTIYDIDVVIITHDHIDHNNDARLLADLAYQMGQSIAWYVDSATKASLSQWLDDSNLKRLYDLGGKRSVTISKKSRHQPLAVLTPFHTCHIQKCDAADGFGYADNTFGFTLELTTYEADPDRGTSFMLGYTSDTKFFKDLHKKLNGVDFLVANISSVYPDELVKRDALNDRHLGLAGLIALLEKMVRPPRILALSEFWSGITDIRYDISKYIGEYLRLFSSDNEWTIVPLESGTNISLPNGRVQCSRCGTYAKRVRMLRPKNEFGEIQFVCDECVY